MCSSKVSLKLLRAYEASLCSLLTGPFTASHDDDDETESECELPQDVEDDGGDTTDTLDDTDHLGMIRFGIEAAESDDEDAEEVLANAIRDRNLIDAHNMGLSVSIEALAEQPEAVVLKTARSLGISTETAAKILTSVGMSILMRSHGHDRDVFAEPRPSASSSKEPAVSNPQAAPSASTSIPTSSTATPVALDIGSATTAGQSIPQTVSKTFEPVLGDFAPSGEADLCVVVGATDAPAPSPFSARKRRTRTSTRGFVSHAHVLSCNGCKKTDNCVRRTRHPMAEANRLHQLYQLNRLPLDVGTILLKNPSTILYLIWTISLIPACFLLA